MKCPKCGCENKNNASFCIECGEKLENKSTTTKMDQNKLIIIGLIVVICILAVGILFASGVFNNDIPLETTDFGNFKMLTPVGSEFEEFTSIPEFGNIGGLVYLKNVGNYSKEVTVFGVSKMGASIPSEMKFDHDEGDVKVFKDKENTGLYMAAITKGDYFFDVMGRDVNAMVKMIDSIEVTGKITASSQETTSSTPATSSSTPSSISILGGSFSTGSADSDKTYARIDVGANHAGENVIVQIWYSRDGNTLNNGNMVPATVHSDGYLEISSADAYKYYPDHATINIYDSNSNLLTSQSVSLSPESGTQYF